jgi:hypothetical protein
MACTEKMKQEIDERMQEDEEDEISLLDRIKYNVKTEVQIPMYIFFGIFAFLMWFSFEKLETLRSGINFKRFFL